MVGEGEIDDLTRITEMRWISFISGLDHHGVTLSRSLDKCTRTSILHPFCYPDQLSYTIRDIGELTLSSFTIQAPSSTKYPRHSRNANQRWRASLSAMIYLSECEYYGRTHARHANYQIKSNPGIYLNSCILTHFTQNSVSNSKNKQK